MGVQLQLFILAYSVAYEFARVYRGSTRSDIGYGIMLHYGLYLFGVLASVNGVVQTSTLSLKVKLITAAACAGVFCCYLLRSFRITPYRASLLLFPGAACLFLPLVAKQFFPAEAQPGRAFEATAK
jgi:hypothetical protein